MAADALAAAGHLDAACLAAEVERWKGARGIAKARRLAGWVEPLTESFGESRLPESTFDAVVGSSCGTNLISSAAALTVNGVGWNFLFAGATTLVTMGAAITGAST